jgi:hypothetical protein
MIVESRRTAGSNIFDALQKAGRTHDHDDRDLPGCGLRTHDVPRFETLGSA